MFLTEDVQKAIAFGDFIKKYASWSLTTEQTIELVKHFNWYNQTVKKIEEHILEVKRSFTKPAESPAVETPSSEG